MSLDNDFSNYIHHVATIFAKRKAGCRHISKLQLKFGLKALTLHFKAQKTYMSTSFSISGKQWLVTTLLHSNLSSHPIHVKSTLR